MTAAAAGRIVLNPHRDETALRRAAARVFPAGEIRAAVEDIRSWPGYAPTPLVELDAAAAGGAAAGSVGAAARGAIGGAVAGGATGGAIGAISPGRILLKLERGRFGLGSFKVLGGAYAVGRRVAGDRDGSAAFVCGSAGNHGLSVAWGARRVGRRVTVFLPADTSDARVARLREQGADVRVVSGDYDEALRRAREAARSGDVLVSDFTETNDLSTAPVLWGYALIVEEIGAASVRPTHVFIPAGVGSLAAAIVAACRHTFESTPRVVVVEPMDAACVFHGLRNGRRTTIPPPTRTRLAPLACRVPSADAWPLLLAGVAAGMRVSDEEVLRAGLLLPDPPPEADNCGAAALAGILAAASEPAVRDALGLGADSTVVALITE